MPSYQQHSDQAQHNRDLAESWCSDDDCLDWAMTATFYSALHSIQSMFAHQCNSVPKSHADRDEWLTRTKAPENIFDAYQALKTRSEWARYECWAPTEAEMKTDWLPQLDVVDQYVQSKI